MACNVKLVISPQLTIAGKLVRYPAADLDEGSQALSMGESCW